MSRYLVRRISFGIMAIFGATLIVFALSRLGGDPRNFYVGQSGYGVTDEQWERLGKKMGLDQPVPVQYARWMGDLLTGEFGISITTQAPVEKVIVRRLGATAQLAVAAWLFGTVVGIPLGVLSATNRGGLIDYAARGFALLGQSVPVFATGLVLIVIFSVHLGWLPSGTRGDGFPIKHLILPAITLGWLPAATYLRLTRSSMLEVLDQEYIKLARAKGLHARVVLWKHAFRNAIIVPLTFSALLFIGFITGTVVAETVFSWPGVGRLAANAVFQNDFPLLSVIVLFTAIIYILIVLALDLLYAILDPRIRLN